MEALEGLDGAGKTTLVAPLVEELESLGLRVATAASPGKTMVGSILRANIGTIEPEQKTVLFTYEMKRAQRQLSPYADVVLWDRYLDTIRVSNTDNADRVLWEIAKDIVPPDDVFYLEITPDESWRREEKVSDHPLDRAWIETKYRRYQNLISREPSRFTVIDASLGREAVFRQVRDILIERLAPIIERNRVVYKLLFDIPGVVRFLPDDPFEVKPGVFLPMFMNFKETWAKPWERKMLAQELASRIGEKFTWVVGLESGGSYFAVTVANLLGLPLTLIRKTNKEYGEGDFVVGDTPPKGTNVALIDDVYATGKSAAAAAGWLKEAGCKSNLFTIFSYSSDAEIKKRIGVAGTSLTYFKALRRLALEQSLLTEDQAADLMHRVDVYRTTIFT